MMDWCEILATPLPTAEVVAFVQDAGAGGIAVFLGTTRAENSAAGQGLLALDYEVYRDMAGPQLVDLARRARERWPILKLVLLHRTGRVDVGEPSVVIAVSTPHRAAAFEACHWLIDTLKAEASIWKKETWSEGPGTWVDPQSKP
ncbi:MAG: molybdopterin biosynthesis MoaE protein [Phycisphaerales bacterium]|nr:molybdopterin biosynthesis MoaE protein [Phycisphaerales bacterium]